MKLYLTFKKSCFLPIKILIWCYPPSMAFIHQDWILSGLVLKGWIIVIAYPWVLVIKTSSFDWKILSRATVFKLQHITTMSILKRSICDLNRLSYNLIYDITIRLYFEVSHYKCNFLEFRVYLLHGSNQTI